MLASVYSYRVMVKSVSSCCVRGSRVLSDPVTYTQKKSVKNMYGVGHMTMLIDHRQLQVP